MQRNDIEQILLENQATAASKILESFGNASTVLNNNASRFNAFAAFVHFEIH